MVVETDRLMTDDWQAGVDYLLKVGRLEAGWSHSLGTLLQCCCPQSAAGCMWVVGRV